MISGARRSHGRWAHNPVVGGVAQIFHDLLVKLRLLLVAEVEDGEKEDGQEEGEEVKGGSLVEEVTTTWMARMMEWSSSEELPDARLGQQVQGADEPLHFETQRCFLRAFANTGGFAGVVVAAQFVVFPVWVPDSLDSGLTEKGGQLCTSDTVVDTIIRLSVE